MKPRIRNPGVPAPTGEHDMLWGAAAVVILVFAVATSFSDSTKSQALAAWFQAIGALVGIGIAIAVPTWQRNNARREARFDAAQRLRAIARIIKLGAEATGKTVRDIDQAYEHLNSLVIEKEKCDEILHIIESIEVQQLPTPTAVTVVIDARHHMRAFCAGVQLAAEEKLGVFFVSDKVEKQFRNAYLGLVESYNSLANECNVIEVGSETWGHRISDITSAGGD